MEISTQVDIACLPTVLEVGGLPKEDLIKKVLEAGFQIDQHTLEFIQQNDFPCTASKKTVRLAYKTYAEMGFTEDVTYGEIQTWIRKHGKLCDKDLALWLCLVYSSPPLVGWIAVESEPTPEKYDHDPCTLHVINSGDGMAVGYCYFRPHHKRMDKKIFCYIIE